MVVGDDHLVSGRARPGHRVYRRDAAVAGDDEPRADLRRLGQAGGTEVVAIPEPMRHERVRDASRPAQGPREHGRGTLAIHVVVAVHEDGGPVADRLRHQLHCAPHSGPLEGIGEPLELRAQERLGAVGPVQPALDEQGRERLRDGESRRQVVDGRRVRRGGERPPGRNHSAT